MDILYLSHCVPNPPDKGERIRAFRELDYLCSRFRVHLVCFGREPADRLAAGALSKRCASTHVEILSNARRLPPAATGFALGRSLTLSFFASRSMSEHVARLARNVRLSATVVYTAVMTPFAPAGVPLLLDLVDVDSEKWLAYAARRTPGFLYGLEGRRFRRAEIAFARRARRVLLSTDAEVELFRGIAPGVPASCFSNGVDAAYFDPAACAPAAELRGRRALMFVGTMDYFPNVEAVSWFARDIFPKLRERDAALEFFIVGRNPSEIVKRLAALPGVTVTGGLPDIRPLVSAACAIVAPLKIARGIQNKVLEALSMGKTVLASAGVCRTFGDTLPPGIVRCGSEREFVEAALALPAGAPAADPAIREAARRRFHWDRTLEVFAHEFDALLT